jgi:hypothetical protein
VACPEAYTSAQKKVPRLLLSHDFHKLNAVTALRAELWEVEASQKGLWQVVGSANLR